MRPYRVEIGETFLSGQQDQLTTYLRLLRSVSLKRFRRAAHLLISGVVYAIDYPADGHGTNKLTRDTLLKRRLSSGTLCLVFSYAACASNLFVSSASFAGETQSNQKVDSADARTDEAKTALGTTDSAENTPNPNQKIIVKPGIPVTVTTQTEDLTPTDDPELAKRQVDAYPESPEASFIYAVALTRTSRVEEALKEVRRARRLAEKEGGPAYFDKMIASYEEMLKNYPDENRVRYGLAWAYYMKAYLVARQSKREQEYLEKLKQAAAAKESPKKDAKEGAEQKAPAWLNAWAAPYMPKDKDGNPIKLPELKTGPDAPHIKGAMEHAAPSVVPQVRSYYQSALSNLDELIKRKPDDVWAIAYRAHLNLEYSGDLDSSMTVWKECAQRFPNNPAAFFFLGEGYLKQGNLKECLSNISRAVALRGLSK